ncbi:MAG: translation initiation factor IF-5A [Candidatus Aenigmarchaeota archaeon]|nr:translation initiation factor IF-5A [Candidatus Aenigmarchaeota archaeon]
MSVTKSNIKSLKPGRYIVIDGEPCKVTKLTSSKAGKHGAAKVRIEAVTISEGKRKELVKPSSTEVDVPIINKKKAQVISLTGDSVQLMDMETYETFEASIPDELKGNLTEGQEISYWEVMGKRILMG